jgi:hypothetical protein
MAGYIGTVPVPQATETRDVYTATSSQTTFATGGYTPNFVSVYLNGVHLARADYTATNGTDVVLAVGAAADDTVEIVSFNTFEVSAQTFTGDVTASGGTFLPTGDTAAGDDAAVGYAAADGLVLTGQGTTSDVTIKNDADATVMSILTGTTGATFAGDVIVPDGDLILGSTAVTSTAAELNILDGVTATAAEINLIDGGTTRGTTTIADGDGVLVNDAGTMRQTNVTTLATYMGTKITGGSMVYLASSGAISDGTASVAFTQFDATKYDHYAFYFQHVVPVTDQQVLYGHHSTDGGSSYDTTDGDYHYSGTTDTTGFFVSAYYAGDGLGSDSGEYGVVGLAYLYAPHVAAFTVMSPINIVSQLSAGGFYGQLYTAASARLAAEDTDAIKFQFPSGNIESGEIVMYGIANGT